jgi:carboxyl-terminal processing protease
MTDSQISEMLRGPQGSKVNISVRRKGSSKLFEYAITRDKFPLIKFFSDRGSYGDGGTGGIQAPEATVNTAEFLAEVGGNLEIQDTPEAAGEEVISL